MSLSFSPHPILVTPTPEQIVALSKTPEGANALIEWHKKHESAIKAAEEDPVYKGFPLDQQKLVEDTLYKPEIDEVWVLGGNRCLGGKQQIYLSCKERLVNVEDIDHDFRVLSYDERTGQEVEKNASRPFRKPNQDIYLIQTSDGQRLEVSLNHRVLANSQWHSVSELSETVFPDAYLTKTESDDFSDLPLSDGDHLLSILDISLLASLQGVRRLWNTIRDSQSGCRLFYRCGDGQLHRVLGIGQGVPPSLDDALERIFSCGESLDDRGYKLAHTRLYLLCDRPSTLDDLRRFWDQSSDILSRASCKPCRSVSQSREDQAHCKDDLQSTVESSHQLQSTRGFDQRGIRFYYVSAYDGKVKYFCPVVKSDYLRNDVVWDFEVEDTHNYFIGNIVNHNSGKSFSAARMVMQALLENPGTEITCWAQNEDASIERQQPYLWEMLPAKYKTKMKDETSKINWSKASGFTAKKFILPNGSVCYFKYYSQFQNDDTMIEGATFGAPEKECGYVNIGTWCDEYLGDDTLLGRLRSRCGDYNAKILLTFTPMRGYTPTVGKMLDGASVLEAKKAEHPVLDGEMMPLRMKPKDKPEASVIFYHSDMNPFSNWKRLFRNNANEDKATVKKVLYGYPTKSMTAMFSSFSHHSHVYNPEEKKYNFADKKKWTTYQVIDPAGTKSWCSIWASVNADKDIRVWAEFPDRATYGEWAVEGKAVVRQDDSIQWKKGPAAEHCGGLSLRDLKTEWTKIEDKVEVYERIIDVRFSHNPKQTAESGDKTLADELAEIGVWTVPSVGATEEVGLPLIQQALALPDKSKPFDYNTNRPRLMFSESVGNCIFSVLNYCKNGKKDEALKDFIDLLRYLMTAGGGNGPEHYDESAFKQERTTGGY